MSLVNLLNDYVIYALSFVVFLFLGGILAVFFNSYLRKRRVRKAQEEAEDLIQEAKDTLELLELDQKERIQEIEAEVWTRDESYLLQIEEHIEELEELVTEKKQKSDNHYSQIRQKALTYENKIQEEEANLKNEEQLLSQLKKKASEFNQELVKKLSGRAQWEVSQAKAHLSLELENESYKRGQRLIEEKIAHHKEHSELLSKSLLDKVLSRAMISYCPERGIPSIYFENESQRKFLTEENGALIRTLVEITGCDIIVEEGHEIVGVAGFDPVRREFTRRILERLMKEKRSYSSFFIKKVADNIKRELFAQIKKDGDSLARELRLENLHPEIRKMMGSLRYRYSFTQNQYFHCFEVAWLCGLLASELGSVEIKKARRSGMLHDLGKAMDHEVDGGHAMIGAQFIEERGESPEIVHAVKAHHFDVQPSTDLAFLVIAADAISGSRPGARRSTIESYTQKVNELESIALSFEGVTDCYILNGGRECRVLVNGKKVDDLGSLNLSKEIANRIENECNYPGQIKVVVVRETLTVEMTKTH